jgi:hypothetical protein
MTKPSGLRLEAPGCKISQGARARPAGNPRRTNQCRDALSRMVHPVAQWRTRREPFSEPATRESSLFRHLRERELLPVQATLLQMNQDLRCRLQPRPKRPCALAATLTAAPAVLPLVHAQVLGREQMSIGTRGGYAATGSGLPEQLESVAEAHDTS